MSSTSCPPVAVILAAGRGSRLGRLTAERPKALLEVGGRSLVERQIEALRVAGLPSILLVTGFARERFAGLLAEDVREVYNDRWASTNNLVTLASAGSALDNGFLLLNSDVLFDPAILHDLLTAPAPCLLAVDDRKPLAEEEMKVVLDGDGRLREIAKSIDPARARGEYIGLARFDAPGALRLRAVLRDLERSGRTGEWYESAIQELAQGWEIRTCSTQGRAWIEIDTPEDLRCAEGVAARLAGPPPHGGTGPGGVR